MCFQPIFTALPVGTVVRILNIPLHFWPIVMKHCTNKNWYHDYEKMKLCNTILRIMLSNEKLTEITILRACTFLIFKSCTDALDHSPLQVTYQTYQIYTAL